MILDLFSKERPVLTLEEIAGKIDVSTITAYRYVKVMCEAGMLTLDEGNVSLSAKILRFVNLFWQQDRLVTIAKEPISRLGLELNETIALCQLESPDVVCTYRVESSLSLRTSFSIGQRMAIYAGAFARSISAFLPERELNAIIRQTAFEPFTERTITDPREFQQKLEQIRRNGYDISYEEVDPGVTALAVPIHLSGRIGGSLGLAIPSVRYDPQNLPELIHRLKEVAEQIAQRMQKDDFISL